MPPRTDEPRPHHYQFAHRALPSSVHRFGVGLVTSAAHRELSPALLTLWSEVGSRLPDEQRLDPAGLTAVYTADSLAPMVMVTMPPARYMVEAHFAAIVALGDQARYLVLEESWSPNRVQATVIGEWTTDGHFNLGPGPAPEREGFAHAVRALINPAS
jgi:hypothetical protein